MLELNRAKVGARGAYRVSDAFALEATHAHDVVFFGFFLSHVPRSRFDAFWGVVEGLLAPSGRVFFVDESDHGLWQEDWIDAGAGIVRRPLTDGSVHRAVKVLWQPARLRDRLATLGWWIEIESAGPFVWGGGTTSR